MKEKTRFGHSSDLSIASLSNAKDLAKNMEEKLLNFNPKGEGENYILKEGLRPIYL